VTWWTVTFSTRSVAWTLTPTPTRVRDGGAPMLSSIASSERFPSTVWPFPSKWTSLERMSMQTPAVLSSMSVVRTYAPGSSMTVHESMRTGCWVDALSSATLSLAMLSLATLSLATLASVRLASVTAGGMNPAKGETRTPAHTTSAIPTDATMTTVSLVGIRTNG